MTPEEEMILWPCHLPPDNLKPKYIFDLGANIGRTMIDFNRRWPEAKILGIELDYDNFKEAYFSTKEIENLYLIHGGVNSWDGTCQYKKINSLSHKVINSAGDIPSFTIDRLFQISHFPYIDYIKMDIEGSEESILNDTAANWPNIAKCINVEPHYEPETCEKQLKNLGFITQIKKYTSEWNTWFHIIGINKNYI